MMWQIIHMCRLALIGLGFGWTLGLVGIAAPPKLVTSSWLGLGDRRHRHGVDQSLGDFRLGNESVLDLRQRGRRFDLVFRRSEHQRGHQTEFLGL